ncbi:HAD-like domain-containing protein [Massariosphaeria phaeospora]|uniref:HAD-like domain-containing protein n=1 Tax=Massariosphaeria phaeospora TaxID=100035 RepID=A0A7C8MDT8_9PLEO|nr:HAD-like domain-containing protein [Massariosphaeria phaeospora]
MAEQRITTTELLTDFKVLCFDVYGTLVDWESGILKALQPMLEKSGKSDLDPKQTLATCHKVSSAAQRESPGLAYSELLTTIHPKICQTFGLQEPTEQESKAFGASVGQFEAFPDSVSALKQLSKRYKLVVLSNVDNASFAATNAGPLEGFKFDAVFTAQDIGSYKPDLRNFEYMLKEVKSRWGFEKEQVLSTAQSQFHDHHPAREMGMDSAWIYRPDAIMGNRDDPVYRWKFDTLQELATLADSEGGI